MSRVEELRRLLTTAENGQVAPLADPCWRRDDLAGRLTEISGHGASAALTAAIGLVLDTQRQGDPVAWVTLPHSIFYPPDVADSGVDLAALIVIRAPLARDAGRAADQLVRSGGFGLVVLDLGKDAFLPDALQGRLVGLAQKHDTAVVCLTDKPPDAPSLGSMVSLRVAAVRERLGAEAAAPVAGEGSRAAGPFRCRIDVRKDKRRGPGWRHAEVVRGPAGLR
jgi:recombination protein RecA